MWNLGHDPFKRSSSALKSPDKACLMCNGWKVFPKRWGERNTEEERGSLKELPWQSGTISLCTYTHTLYLSHSHSSSSLSLFPSLMLAFLSFCLLCFPLTVDLGVSSPCLVYVGIVRKTRRKSGKERKRPWEGWVGMHLRVSLCLFVKQTAFPKFSCFNQANTSTCVQKLSPWIEMYYANQNAF